VIASREAGAIGLGGVGDEVLRKEEYCKEERERAEGKEGEDMV